MAFLGQRKFANSNHTSKVSALIDAIELTDYEVIEIDKGSVYTTKIFPMQVPIAFHDRRTGRVNTDFIEDKVYFYPATNGRSYAYVAGTERNKKKLCHFLSSNKYNIVNKEQRESLIELAKELGIKTDKQIGGIVPVKRAALDKSILYENRKLIEEKKIREEELRVLRERLEEAEKNKLIKKKRPLTGVSINKEKLAEEQNNLEENKTSEK